MEDEMEMTNNRIDDIATNPNNTVQSGEIQCMAKEIMTYRTTEQRASKAIGILEKEREEKLEVDYVKYAEEAGAACEEMKYGIDAVIEEISIVASRRDGDQTDFKEGFDAGLRKAVKRIQKHLSKYLDE